MSARAVGRVLAMMGGVVLGETLYAVLRPAPLLEEFDPSGVFGDPTLPSLRLAVLGDSSVTAPGVSGPEKIWVSRLAARFGEYFHVELKSFAISGSRARDLVARQLTPALEYQPDIVFLSVGANDALKGITPARFAIDLERLIVAFQSGGIRVVLTGVGDLGTIPRLFPPVRELMTLYSNRFNQTHRDLAHRHGAIFIDQRSDDRRVWLEDKSLWAEDHFHVSARGHERWGGIAWDALAPIIPDLLREREASTH